MEGISMHTIYRQMFLGAIADALSGIEYHLVNDAFYVYKREIGVVIKVTFDAYSNVSAFRIYGGASAFCSSIELTSGGGLSVGCRDLNDYALRCGLPAIDNDNPLGAGKRYRKAVLEEKLQKNMALFKKSMLADLLGIESVEDYYNYEVKAGGIRYTVEIPFPCIDTFFLCISLGKFREASHIYLRMLLQYMYTKSIDAINESMHLSSKDAVMDALDRVDVQVNSNKDTFIRFEKEAEAVESVLRDHEASLMEEVENRIDKSRIICDRFFTGKESTYLNEGAMRL